MPSKLGITSISLGHSPPHSLRTKLHAASRARIQGIELFFSDLAHYCASEIGPPSTLSNLLAAAHAVRRLCDTLRLEIICLQPFWNYEGLADRGEHARRIEELKTRWFPIARALRTDIIQIPSSFLSREVLVHGEEEMEVLVQDLREVAELGLTERPPVRFVYESLAWGTLVDTWEKGWEVVQRVDRENLGVCLDTFNIAGRVYADPASETGRTVDAERDMAESMRRLKETVDLSKVFYVQVVDAERLARPLVEGHELFRSDQPVRMSWSRNCRLFYGEHERGAYLPVQDIARAIFHDLGYEGWVSLEYFNRDLASEDPNTPEMLASRAATSWKRLTRDLNLVSDVVEDERIQAVLLLFV